MRKHLHEIVMLKLMEGFLREIRAGELDIRVNPCQVPHIRVEPSSVGDQQIQAILFMPELVAGSQLKVVRVVWVGDLKVPLAERDFARVQDGRSVDDSLRVLPVEVVSASESWRI